MVVEIGRTIVSRDVLQEYFLCDLLKCKGACCIEGDSGAPVTDDEVSLIMKAFPTFKKYLTENHLREVEKQSFSVIDKDGDLVTPLVNDKQCVYSFKDENGILKCAIEKAYFEDGSKFRKPVSCHLFPIRITEYKRFDAVNYERADICKPGRKCGKKQKLPLHVFLKEPLIRKYGAEWYKEIEVAADHLKANRK